MCSSIRGKIEIHCQKGRNMQRAEYDCKEEIKHLKKSMLVPCIGCNNSYGKFKPKKDRWW